MSSAAAGPRPPTGPRPDAPAGWAPAPCPHPTPPGTRIVFAHRGARALAPENTPAALRAAARAGARWVEIDVDVIGDGTVIVIHDSRLDRTTDRTGSYYRLRAADLPCLSPPCLAPPRLASPCPASLHSVPPHPTSPRLALPHLALPCLPRLTPPLPASPYPA